MRDPNKPNIGVTIADIKPPFCNNVLRVFKEVDLCNINLQALLNLLNDFNCFPDKVTLPLFILCKISTKTFIKSLGAIIINSLHTFLPHFSYAQA